jgi:hypothetical protein
MASAEPTMKGSSRVLRGLLPVPVVLLAVLAVTLPDTAIAAEPTSGYTTSTATEPTSGYTTSTATPEPPKPEPPKVKTGTLPEHESKPEVERHPPERVPKTETSPAKPEAEPPPKLVVDPVKASKLPFTGLDLRWELGVGLLLVGAGFSLVAAQRRPRKRPR